MIIIGIDPGLVNTGYGIISIKNETPSLIDFGIIAPNTKDSVPERIFTIFTDVCHLIEKYNCSLGDGICFYRKYFNILENILSFF